MIGRFNKQFLPIINLLRQIDRLEVPAVTPESALAAAIPLRKRDTNAPQYLKSEMEMEEEKVRPTAVKGITKIDAEKIDVSITTEKETSVAAQAAARVHRDHIAMQNAMPEWYTRSTIGENSSKAGRSSVNTPGNTASTNGVAKAGEDKGSLNKEEQDEL
jgi:transcription initiation factor TFIIE subunit alpha